MVREYLNLIHQVPVFLFKFMKKKWNCIIILVSLEIDEKQMLIVLSKGWQFREMKPTVISKIVSIKTQITDKDKKLSFSPTDFWLYEKQVLEKKVKIHSQWCVETGSDAHQKSSRIRKKQKLRFVFAFSFFTAYVICKKNYSFSRVVFLFFSVQNCQLFLFKNKCQQWSWDNNVLKR